MSLIPSYKGTLTIFILFIYVFIYFHVLIEFKTNSSSLGERYGSARNFEDLFLLIIIAISW